MLYDAVVETVPPLALGFTLAGGVLYSLRRDLPCLAAAALPERDLAWLRLARRGPAIIRLLLDMIDSDVNKMMESHYHNEREERPCR